MSKSILHVDLHPIAKNDTAIHQALSEAFEAAESKNLKAIEIIPGKGSGQLMKRVQKWLKQPAQKKRYKRINVDQHNHGRLFVYF